MKNIVKGMLLFVIITVISFLMPELMNSTEYDVQAGEAEWSDDEITEGEDPFTVLEIMPYRGMAEIGYLVDGQEPIDQELMQYNSAGGEVSFLGGAIDAYRSYEEKPTAAFGTYDSGWVPAKAEVNLNGYFEYVGNNNGGYYSISNGAHFERVEDGTGNYEAVVTDGTAMDQCYTSWDPTNKKNVNAYFVYGKPAGVNLFNSTYAYSPYSVTENPTHNGDYDYNVTTKTFCLNKGNGRYDVIFTREKTGNMYYIMKDNLEIVNDGTGTYSFPLNYVSKDKGNYASLTGEYMTFNQRSGDYRFVQSDDALMKPSNFFRENGKIWVKNQKITLSYQYHYKVQLINNEWFKTMTLGVPADRTEDYPVEVITITPDDLNKPENQHYIDDADLIYINSNYNHNNAYIRLYELYSYEGQNLPENEKYYDGTKRESDNLNFAVHDLSWDNVIKVFKRAAGIGCNKAAMIIDDTFYIDAINGSGAYSALQRQVTVPYSYNGTKATMCNMAKLYIMIYQRNMIDFYNAFLQTDNPLIHTKLITKEATATNLTGYTGSFVRPDMMPLSATADAALYWNGDTFLPYGLDADGNLIKYTSTADMVSHGVVNYNITADTSDLTNNVLTFGGNDIFTAKFIEPRTIPSDSQEEAVIHLSSQNNDGSLVSPSNITIGDLVNVVTNDGNGFEDVGAVSYPEGSNIEGPPSETPEEDSEDITDDGTDGSGLRNYKRVLNIQPTADFTASEAAIRTLLTGLNIQIVNMTSTEFNGCIDDINSMYDMIYMGSGAGRFNLSSTGSTVFNSSTTLNGNYYFGIGDLRIIKINNRQNENYRGNDITIQKKSDLEAYLNAGYPIVLDSKLFTLTGITSPTNLRDFISNAKTRYQSNFLNAAENTGTTASIKLTFKTRLNAALNVVRPLINLVTPLVAETAPVNYIYVDPATDLLTVKFQVVPKGKFPSTYNYDAYLSMDENGDGIFDAAEQLNVISSDGSSTIGLPESRYRTYTYQYNIAGHNGVYQWKLEVRRHDNSNIRSIVTGYTANSDKEDIYILHIRDNASAYNLQSKINDAVSLIYQYAGSSALNDYALHITSMTVDQFEQLYVTQHYTTPTSAQTNKLSGYHLLIMDNPVDTISNTYGARTNIYDEMNKRLGIIFTKGSMNFENQSYYFAPNQYSLENYFTYNLLNENAFTKPGAKLFIFNSLETNGDLSIASTYQTAYLTKTNEGPITRYPYQINQAILSAANSYSDFVTMDFNLTGKRLIGWYCLSDAKSPLVRNTFSTGTADADLYKGLYSSSPNDVKNNYYLFSNGLCYYSGITLASADKSGNDEEIRLFVNTIIAAYGATGRIVSTPPVITITDPVPDAANTINVTDADIVGNDFILTFNISGSSSDMSMSVRWNGSEAAGSWDDTIYEVTGSSNGPPITIDTTDKVVGNHTYVLKIPVTSINGTNLLTLTVENTEGNAATKDVTLNYVPKPVVTIVDPAPVTNASKGYLYADIDYNAADTNEDYLDTAEALAVVFRVEKSITDVSLDITSEGEDLTDGIGYDVTVTDNTGTAVDFTKPYPNGLYTMYIPVALMKDHNNREIVITATDSSGNIGQASVTLLRRSLFPLD